MLHVPPFDPAGSDGMEPIAGPLIPKHVVLL